MWLERHTNYKEKIGRWLEGRVHFSQLGLGLWWRFRNLEVLSFSTERVFHSIRCMECIVFVIISSFCICVPFPNFKSSKQKREACASATRPSFLHLFWKAMPQSRICTDFPGRIPGSNSGFAFVLLYDLEKVAKWFWAGLFLWREN